MIVRPLAFSALSLALLPQAGHAQTAITPPRPDHPIVLHAARVLDVATGHVTAPGEILVEGERITAVGAAVQHPAERRSDGFGRQDADPRPD